MFRTGNSIADGELEDCDEESDEANVFDHVTFRYNEGGAPVLDDISFTLKRGQTLGIIGATGSGKSTLGALIGRLYDADEGEIEILGHPIRSYRLSFLHDKVSIVLQKARLLRGTIEGNMRLARPDATAVQIEQALRDAQAWDFVSDKGLDAPVEAGGRNFSGGQRQRLSIARGLVHGGEILILDDSFSALDYVTDSRVRKALSGRSMTKVIISQRTSSILDADLILLLDNGRIIARGRHEELMASSEVYSQIYYTQFEKEVENA